MKAAVRYEYVDFPKIEVLEIPQPIPADNEVLVKVHATTVNRTDCALVNGKPWIMKLFIGLTKPKLPVLGTDFAGEIIAVGSSVSQFKIGDRVMGFRDEGLSSQADYLSIGEDSNIITIPDHIEYIEAVACMEAPHYAYNWIKNRTFTSDQRVLVNGGTGAIGTAIIQFMKYYGVEITAVANTKNLDLMTQLGAHKVYNYEEEDFTQCELKYDYVLDAVGKSTFGKCKHLLKDKGIYMSSELGPYMQNPILALLTSWKKKKVIFPLPTDIKSSMIFMQSILSENKYKPVIDRFYPLEDVSKAYEYVNSGNKTGNVILTIT